MTALTLYSRPGCRLCDEMKTVVGRVAESMPLTILEIDISADPDLEARYAWEIPVLMIEGKLAAKYRVTESELRRILRARRAEESEGGG